MTLKIESLKVAFGDQTVLNNLDLEVDKGELVAVLGVSGSGKTTLLKSICGLQDIQSGKISLNEKDITKTPTHKRNISVVFQDLRLFPHLTVKENIIFPMRMKGIESSLWDQRVEQLLEDVKLPDYANYKISQLSGGQQQRVALARALAHKPDLLLLDEPFSSLDEPLRLEMRQLVVELQRKHQITCILITHDRNEALSMASKIAFLYESTIYQYGTIHELMTRPKNQIVANFFGKANYFPVQVIDNKAHSPFGVIPILTQQNHQEKWVGMVRPTSCTLSKEKQGHWLVDQIKPSLESINIHLQSSDIDFPSWECYLSYYEAKKLKLEMGDRVEIHFNNEDISLIPWVEVK